MTDGQIRIGAGGEIPVEVTSSLGKPATAKLRAESGDVVIPCPPPGGIRLTREQRPGFLAAVSVLGEIADLQVGGG